MEQVAPWPHRELGGAVAQEAFPVGAAPFPTLFLEVSIQCPVQWAQDTRFQLPMETPSARAVGHGWRAGQAGIVLADLVQTPTSQDLTLSNEPTGIS